MRSSCIFRRIRRFLESSTRTRNRVARYQFRRTRQKFSCIEIIGDRARFERRKTMNSISSQFAAGIEEIRKSWIWFLVFGVVLMILGAACIAKSQTATTFSILVLGWVLAISGVVWLVGAFQTWIWGGFFVYLLNEIIRCVTGYLLIRHPAAGAEPVP